MKEGQRKSENERTIVDSEMLINEWNHKKKVFFPTSVHDFRCSAGTFRFNALNFSCFTNVKIENESRKEKIYSFSIFIIFKMRKKMLQCMK